MHATWSKSSLVCLCLAVALQMCGTMAVQPVTESADSSTSYVTWTDGVEQWNSQSGQSNHTIGTNPPQVGRVSRNVIAQSKWVVWDPVLAKAIKEKDHVNLIILPLASMIIFVIGLCIKGSHWWNEDIRQADGLLMNVYTADKPPRAILKRVYSVERHSVSRQSLSTTQRRGTMHALRHHRTHFRVAKVVPDPDCKRLQTLNSSDDETEGVHGPGRHSPLHDGAAHGSDTRPKKGYNTKSKQLRDIPGTPQQRRTHDATVISIENIDELNREHGHKTLAKELSSVSTRSSGARSDCCSESLPLLLHRDSSSNKSSAILQCSSVDEARLTMPTAHKLLLHHHRVKLLEKKARSETNLGHERAKRSPPMHARTCGSTPSASVARLLRNSINLNINLLNSMCHEEVSETDTITASQGQLFNTCVDDPFYFRPIHSCANHKSKSCSSSSQFSSSTDCASSTPTGTSITALSSMTSSSSTTHTPTKSNVEPHSVGDFKRTRNLSASSEEIRIPGDSFITNMAELVDGPVTPSTLSCHSSALSSQGDTLRHSLTSLDLISPTEKHQLITDCRPAGASRCLPRRHHHHPDRLSLNLPLSTENNAGNTSLDKTLGLRHTWCASQQSCSDSFPSK